MSRASATTLLSVPLIALPGCGDVPITTPADAVIPAPALQQALVVQRMVELEDALASARPGEKILIPAGDYELEQTLLVPDGVTLKGEGTMGHGGTNGRQRRRGGVEGCGRSGHGPHPRMRDRKPEPVTRCAGRAGGQGAPDVHPKPQLRRGPGPGRGCGRGGPHELVPGTLTRVRRLCHELRRPQQRPAHPLRQGPTISRTCSVALAWRRPC